MLLLDVPSVCHAMNEFYYFTHFLLWPFWHQRTNIKIVFFSRIDKHMKKNLISVNRELQTQQHRKVGLFILFVHTIDIDCEEYSCIKLYVHSRNISVSREGCKFCYTGFQT